MSKRRDHHKQDPNLLGDWLNAKLEALEPHRTTLAVVAGGVLVLTLLGMFVFTGDNAAAARDWSLYLSAFASDDPRNGLESLATNTKGTGNPAIWYAKQALADQLAARGARSTFTNRTEAKELLDKAVKLYKEVEAAASSQPDLRNRARLGLAGAYESLVLPDDAIKILEQVQKDAGKDSVLSKTAEESLARLNNPRTLETLTWFASVEPAPKTDPHGLKFGEGVSDRPDFPGVKPLGTAPGLPGDDPNAPETPKTETPDEKTTDDPKPEEKTPEEKKPEEKPAETPPAATPKTETPPATAAPPATPPAPAAKPAGTK